MIRDVFIWDVLSWGQIALVAAIFVVVGLIGLVFFDDPIDRWSS